MKAARGKRLILLDNYEFAMRRFIGSTAARNLQGQLTLDWPDRHPWTGPGPRESGVRLGEVPKQPGAHFVSGQVQLDGSDRNMTVGDCPEV